MNVQRMISIAHDFDQAQSPYRTGNLRNNGIGPVSSLTLSQSSYQINFRQSAPYGILLNEAPEIAYRGANGSTIIHANRHYHWHDNAIAAAVEAINAEIAAGG